MTSGNFEAKLHAFRRTQEGVVVSYVVHPNDVSAALATAPLGTRYMVAFAEIGDDGKPVTSSPHPPPVNGEPGEAKLAKAPANDGIAGSASDRRPFETLPLSQQAAIRCSDKDFIAFLDSHDPSLPEDFDPADIVRAWCGVTSRSELNNEAATAEREAWRNLEALFQHWLTDKRYAHLRRT